MKTGKIMEMCGVSRTYANNIIQPLKYAGLINPTNRGSGWIEEYDWDQQSTSLIVETITLCKEGLRRQEAYVKAAEICGRDVGEVKRGIDRWRSDLSARRVELRHPEYHVVLAEKASAEYDSYLQSFPELNLLRALFWEDVPEYIRGQLVERGIYQRDVESEVAVVMSSHRHIGSSVKGYERKVLTALESMWTEEVYRELESSCLRGMLEEAMNVLTPKQRDALRLRHGFEDGVYHTLQETGELLAKRYNESTSRQAVQDLEAMAIGNLRFALSGPDRIELVGLHPKITYMLRTRGIETGEELFNKPRAELFAMGLRETSLREIEHKRALRKQGTEGGLPEWLEYYQHHPTAAPGFRVSRRGKSFKG